MPRLFVLASENNVPVGKVEVSEDVNPIDVDCRICQMQMDAYRRKLPMSVKREYVRGILRTACVTSKSKEINIHIY